MQWKQGFLVEKEGTLYVAIAMGTFAVFLPFTVWWGLREFRAASKKVFAQAVLMPKTAEAR